MFKNSLIIAVILVIGWSCSTTNQSLTNKEKSKAELFNSVYNPSKIESQLFTINNSIDNIIEGKNGSKFRISKNTFIDTNGLPVIGEIEIELKEALSPLQMVLGNLITTFNGEALQTGGMIYMNATSNGNNLVMDTHKAILTSIPADSIFANMSLFKGVLDSTNTVQWTSPQLLELSNENADSSDLNGLAAFEKSHNLRYSIEGFIEPLDYPVEVQEEVGRIAWEGAGLKITKDSTFKIGEYTVHFYKQNELTTWNQVYETQQGTNSFITDQNVYYIFKLKNLGWANIDRLYSDPRTEEVQLLVNVNNENQFDFVYVTMITQSMYLPGYQKKDGTFSFTHDDLETTKLPVGETATIIATSNSNGQTYFGYQKIKIASEQALSIDLTLTSKEGIEEILKQEI